MGDRHDAVRVGRVGAVVAIGQAVDQGLQLGRAQRGAGEAHRRDVGGDAHVDVQAVGPGRHRIAVDQRDGRAVDEQDFEGPVGDVADRQGHRGEALAGLDRRGGHRAEDVGRGAVLGEDRVVGGRGQGRLVVDRIDVHGRGEAERDDVVVGRRVRSRIDQLGDGDDAVGVGRVLAAVAVGQVVDQRLQCGRAQRGAGEGDRRDVAGEGDRDVEAVARGGDDIAVGQGDVRAVEGQDLAGPVGDVGHRQGHRGEALPGLDRRGGDRAVEVGRGAALGEDLVVAGRGHDRLVVDPGDVDDDRAGVLVVADVAFMLLGVNGQRPLAEGVGRRGVGEAVQRVVDLPQRPLEPQRPGPLAGDIQPGCDRADVQRAVLDRNCSRCDAHCCGLRP